MPERPLKPCGHTGCRQLSRERFCTDHTKDRHRYDRERGSASKRGYDARWRAARADYLKRHPMCLYCYQRGIVTAATVVDHIIPHKGDKALFWDTRNWQPLCKSCHDSKTVREDGGFGNG
ncbi:HNH endonuclease signature motif containing protein [Paenibacillus sp. RUD330]|uniref:HNH endonuclease n=1 Tax=Paenibacillus sp. RUD330 TaxID=2023772 RepID=UPI000B92DA46|nr:HNH endonuclease signature motif containing protein [Paenibacillus sp. RUD330]ASS66565.1 HNH endonuclease [Paenibacillus sp. RUD330]